jgi:hypothetical protein
MLEHLEHQSLGAAGLAPIAKPARNNNIRSEFIKINAQRWPNFIKVYDLILRMRWLFKDF